MPRNTQRKHCDYLEPSSISHSDKGYLAETLQRIKSGYWDSDQHPVGHIYKYLMKSLRRPKNGIWDTPDMIEELRELLADMEILEKSNWRERHAI